MNLGCLSRGLLAESLFVFTGGCDRSLQLQVQGEEAKGYVAADVLAAALAVEPAVCLTSSSRVCTVDCQNRPGTCSLEHGSRDSTNVQLVEQLDLAAVQRMLQLTLS